MSIYFRALEPEDVILVYKWKNDEEMMKDAVGMSRPWSMKDCSSWIESKTRHDPFNYWFAICLNDGSDKMIGYAGVNDIHYVNSSATSHGVVIGEKEYRDGITWIETNLLIFDYIFNRLNLNRFYGYYSETQKITAMAQPLFFLTIEGIGREAIYLNGKYTNLCFTSLLKKEYLYHLEKGEYRMSSIIKRYREYIKLHKQL